MPKPTSLETNRLILKPTSSIDAAFLCQLLNSPKWLQYIGDRGVRSEADAQVYIRERIIPQFERLGFGNYTVTRKSDGAKMGTCGLYDREGLNDIDIGFAFLSEYEGHGYAYEASLCLKDRAFAQWGLKKLLAITTRDNLTSQKLLEKLGLQFYQTTRLPGDEEELLLYQILKSHAQL